MPANRVQEGGVWYAVDLLLSQDASLYLDTRDLRRWLFANARDLSVLNLFAYTGTLGVAALAGGARNVIQVDHAQRFMKIVLDSCRLNHLDSDKMELVEEDCFTAIGYFKTPETVI